MPVLTARGAGIRQRRRWLVRDLDVTIEPGELVAVTGPPGSGRTTTLLALARRFRLSAGTVTIDGRAALGHVPGVSDVEPVFTVTEHIRERLALLGRDRREARSVDLRGLNPQDQGRDLSPYAKQVLGLIVAMLEEPAVLALDGFDAGLDAREQAALLAMLTEIAAGGTAVLLTARELDPAAVTTVIHLGGDARPEPPMLVSPAPTDKTEMSGRDSVALNGEGLAGEAPEREGPQRQAPEGWAPDREAAEREVPEREALEGEALGSESPGSEVPGSEAPGSEAPGSEAPGSEALGSEAPGSEAPGSEAPASEGEALPRTDITEISREDGVEEERER